MDRRLGQLERWFADHSPERRSRLEADARDWSEYVAAGTAGRAERAYEAARENRAPLGWRGFIHDLREFGATDADR